MDIMMPDMDGYETTQAIRKIAGLPGPAHHRPHRQGHAGRPGEEPGRRGVGLHHQAGGDQPAAVAHAAVARSMSGAEGIVHSCGACPGSCWSTTGPTTCWPCGRCSSRSASTWWRRPPGEEALRHLLAGEFALIVLDVQMPVLDGFETARLIQGRERTRYVPIIFLTAISGEPEHYLRGYESGAVDYVYKPFEPEILRAKVSVFAELWSRGATIEAQREELAGRLAELDEAHAGLARPGRGAGAVQRRAGALRRGRRRGAAGAAPHRGRPPRPARRPPRRRPVRRGPHAPGSSGGRHGPGPVDRRVVAGLRPGVDRRTPAGPALPGRGAGRGGGRDRPVSWPRPRPRSWPNRRACRRCRATGASSLSC